MIYIFENAGAILIAALAGLAIVFVYHRATGSYRRAGFGLAVTTLIANTVIVAILAGALILAPVKAGAWIIAVGTAFIIWIGFVAPAVVVSLRYHGIAAGTVARDAGLWLVVIVVEAAVLHAIGLVPPTL